MEKKEILQKVKEVYENNGNLVQYLRDGRQANSIEDIMISYDFQAGSYTKKYYENTDIIDQICKAALGYIDKLPGPKRSIFEAGVGEANKLVTLLNKADISFEWAGGWISPGR